MWIIMANFLSLVISLNSQVAPNANDFFRPVVESNLC